jgi:L-seryl-tRNA(Ser) seleniumtransferase
VDKLTLAALEATLRLFRDTAALPERHQVMRMLTTPPDRIRERAQALAARLREACDGRLEAAVAPGESEIGGGSLAGHSLPTFVVRVRSHQIAAGDLASRLRLGDPPIFARVHEDAVLIDPRTVLLDEEEHIVSALREITSPSDIER